jgi:hypothetical protein
MKELSRVRKHIVTSAALFPRDNTQPPTSLQILPNIVKNLPISTPEIQVSKSMFIYQRWTALSCSSVQASASN